MNPRTKRISIQIGLFVITVITTTLAGVEWQFGRFLFYDENPLTWEYFLKGFAFSVPFLGVLTVHEFGHYFTAKKHKVDATLPYYIPMWLGFLFAPSIGTFGAVIRIKDFVNSRKKYFDIGISGPLAGFVVALGVLFYGFTHLPPPEYIYEIHPEYQEYGLDYADHVYQDEPGSFKLGTTLLFEFFKTYVADPERVPNDHEMIHYPWLFAGFLSLFFTALNLIPIGQLDGGHVLYGLIGSRLHQKVSAILFIIYIFYAGLGTVNPYEPTDDLMFGIPLYLGFLYIVFSRLTPSAQTNFLIALAVFSAQFLLASYNPLLRGYQGWLLFGLLIGRFLGIYHPPVHINHPLSTGRKILGWLALLIFILCFSPEPFIIDY
ncbi:site-2 protease family protein [Catalinimonas niigatensis]|uniref:site-2 protease family protein n=1 Tax=Catalinimonas niigatensis TaxID=1397264 RepID=UPI002666A458|nr:site-2 protease family protein [Catalinimonas niigatensis]WPP51275.1 site-2 protease family protein [Catalinimonas niigatensis]